MHEEKDFLKAHSRTNRNLANSADLSAANEDVQAAAPQFLNSIKNLLIHKLLEHNATTLENILPELLICVESGFNLAEIQQLIEVEFNIKVSKKLLAQFISTHLGYKLISSRGGGKTYKIDENGKILHKLEISPELMRENLAKINERLREHHALHEHPHNHAHEHGTHAHPHSHGHHSHTHPDK